MAVSYPNNGLTNAELIKYLELPEDIINALSIAEGSEFTAARNEFLDALVNKLVYQTVDSATFSNPFKKYDSFPIRFGDSIENIFVEMPKGYQYDKDATDPFVRVNPVVKALYVTLNYEMQYEVTIYDSLLRRAVLNEYGLMNLVDTLIGQLSKAMSIDEYFAQIKLLNNPNNFAQGIEELEVNLTDASEVASTVAHTIVDTVSSFEHPMTSNNKAGVMNVTSPEKVLLVIKYGLLNKVNLDYLTGVFNLSKVDLIKNIITVDGFQIATDDDDSIVGDDIDFIIMDTDAFDNHVALQDGGMIYNPKGKYTNHFANLWKAFGFKTFYNARAFRLVQAD